MRKFLLTSVLGGFMIGSAVAQPFPGNFGKPNLPKPTTPTNNYPKPTTPTNNYPKPTTPVINYPKPTTPTTSIVKPTVPTNNVFKPVPINSKPVPNNNVVIPPNTNKPVIPPLNTLKPVNPLVNNLPKPITPLNNLPKPPSLNNLPKPPSLNSLPKPLVNNGPKPLNNNGPKPLVNNGSLTGGKQVKFVLPNHVNDTIGGITNSGKVDPLTQASLANAMSGQSLSAQDRLLLTGQMLNANLSSKEKAAIAKALQEDLKEKQQMVLPPSPQPLIFPQPLVVPQPLVFPQPQPLVVPQPQPLVIPQPQPLVTPLTPPMGGSDIDTTPPATTEYGLKISEVGASSAASAAGLQAGDILVSLNANRVQSFDDLAKVLQASTGELELVLIRDGEFRSTTVTPQAGKLGVTAEPVAIK